MANIDKNKIAEYAKKLLDVRNDEGISQTLKDSKTWDFIKNIQQELGIYPGKPKIEAAKIKARLFIETVLLKVDESMKKDETFNKMYNDALSLISEDISGYEDINSEHIQNRIIVLEYFGVYIPENQTSKTIRALCARLEKATNLDFSECFTFSSKDDVLKMLNKMKEKDMELNENWFVNDNKCINEFLDKITKK